MANPFGRTAIRVKTLPMQGDPLILFRPTSPSLQTEIFMWVMATARTICCDFLRTENFLEKSGGRATVMANSRRHTASSWIPAVGIQSLWLRIVGTGACKLFRSENFLEKSGGRATVMANSRRHTASSWIPAVGIQSLWLRIVGTGACKLF